MLCSFVKKNYLLLVSVRTTSLSHPNQKIYAQSHSTHHQITHNSDHTPHTNQSHSNIPATYGHQSRTNDIKPKRPPTEQIYTRAADRNLHYQQQLQQQQHHHHQQPQHHPSQQQQHQNQHTGVASNDGKSTCEFSHINLFHHY